jgi:hypothetical protein
MLPVDGRLCAGKGQGVTLCVWEIYALLVSAGQRRHTDSSTVNNTKNR